MWFFGDVSILELQQPFTREMQKYLLLDALQHHCQTNLMQKKGNLHPSNRQHYNSVLQAVEIVKLDLNTSCILILHRAWHRRAYSTATVVQGKLTWKFLCAFLTTVTFSHLEETSTTAPSLTCIVWCLSVKYTTSPLVKRWKGNTFLSLSSRCRRICSYHIPLYVACTVYINPNITEIKWIINWDFVRYKRNQWLRMLFFLMRRFQMHLRIIPVKPQDDSVILWIVKVSTIECMPFWNSTVRVRTCAAHKTGQLLLLWRYNYPPASQRFQALFSQAFLVSTMTA